MNGPTGSAAYSEEMYTTKVPSDLPEEKRREAERIAAEIEEEMKQKQLRGVRGSENFRGGVYSVGSGGHPGEYEDEDTDAADAPDYVDPAAIRMGPLKVTEPIFTYCASAESLFENLRSFCQSSLSTTGF
jgi:hypothetical protein